MTSGGELEDQPISLKWRLALKVFVLAVVTHVQLKFPQDVISDQEQRDIL